MIDLSIIVPTIRPYHLEKWYAAAQKSCTKYKWEVIFIGPYLIPESLLIKENVRFIHSYSNPTVCFQIAALNARGDFILNNTDDGLLQDNSLNEAIDLIQSINHNDIINCTYIEGCLDNKTLELIIENPKPFPDYYWSVSTYPHEYGLLGINQAWRMSPHFLIRSDYYLNLGGMDCSFEYLNFPLHDLIFRSQANGSVIYNSPITNFLCSHIPGSTGDHFAIHSAHFENDTPIFREIYSKPDTIKNRIRIPFDNWKNQEVVWSRRFNKDNLKLQP